MADPARTEALPPRVSIGTTQRPTSPPVSPPPVSSPPASPPPSFRPRSASLQSARESIRQLALHASHGELKVPGALPRGGGSGVSLVSLLNLGDGATKARHERRQARALKRSVTALRLRRWEKALFSVAYITVRDNELPEYLCWLLLIVEDLQLLSFPFSVRHDATLPWVVGVVLEPMRLLHSYNDFAVVNIIALLMLATTICLALYVGVLIVRAGKVPIPALRLLRILFSLQMTALSIPIAQVLIGGLTCLQGEMAQRDVACFSGGHFPLFIADILGLMCYVPLVVVGSLLFLDTQPSSTNPDAKAHGRIDCAAILLRLTFVALDLFTHVSSDHDDHTAHHTTTYADWWYMSLVALGLAGLAVALALIQPYYNRYSTAIRAAFATAACFGMVAALATRSAATGGVWLVAMVPAAVVGWGTGFAVALGVARWQFERCVCRWHHARKLEVEIETEAATDPARPKRKGSILGPRWEMDRIAREKSVSGASPTTAVDETAPAAAKDRWDLEGARAEKSARRQDGNGAAEANRDVDASTDAFMARMLARSPADAVAIGHGANRPPGIPRVFWSSMQVEACLRFIRTDPTDDQVVIGLQLLEKGLHEFDDPLLQYLAAVYLRAYFGNDGQFAAIDLLEAVTAQPALPLDLKFLVFAHERQEADQRRAKGMGHNEGLQVLENAELQNLDRTCKRAHLKSLAAVREVFEALRTGAQDGRITAAVSKLTRARAVASKCYTRLLRRLPKSKNVLRSYAQFLMVVEGNTGKAQQILETVEEAEIRESQVPGRSRIPGISVDPIAELETATPSSPSRYELSSRAFRSPTSESGSTGSRAQRQKLVGRRLLFSRVAHSQSRRNLAPILVLVATYVACLVTGLLLASRFFDNCTDVVTHKFFLARDARRKVTEVIDAVHNMAYSSYFASGAQWADYVTPMAAEFAAAYTQLEASLKSLESVGLPYVSAQPSLAEATFRVDVRENTSIPHAYDFTPMDASPLDLVTAVYKAGLYAKAYPTYGTFLAPVYESADATNFVHSNFNAIFDAISLIPALGLSSFLSLLNGCFYMLLAVMSGSVLVLAGAAAYTLIKPIGEYFRTERQLLRVLHTVPKRVAQSMVTTLDEEIETFNEVLGMDEDGDDQENGDNAGLTAPSTVTVDSTSRVDLVPRVAHARARRWIVGLTLAAVVMTVGTFLVPLWASNSVTYIQELLKSNQRRQALRILNLQLRETVFPSTILFKAQSAIGSVTAANAILESTHAAAVASDNPYSVSAVLPHLTQLTMPCNATDPGLWCTLALPGNLSAGVRYTPTIPLDQAIWTMTDLVKALISTAQPGCELVGATLDAAVVPVRGAGNISITPMNPFDPQYLLFRTMSMDLQTRLTLVDSAMSSFIAVQVENARRAFYTLWLVTLVATVGAAGGLLWTSVKRWRDQVIALATILVLVPPHVLKAQWPEAAALVESGGAALDAAAEDEGGL
ncbi:hypothetical protein AMAG_07933 [Allomyces macrogynus ATCC 38327]|uniref:TmcB/TmcC TPR repeats domain-containing protein n=1 Tax=Allomyces macrogynus (strain ATCC 38327) TaxID=578462 RepID=A0A0L0SJU3_ALLM3|nr:hypothetical protein AMAG_07933 [Allomyces macrogynus ATCC 38327]|eukprot:KNE62747.1 hypothetical protein AMAG_07933 [Allomyces macrogynus ATCC 38327]